MKKNNTTVRIPQDDEIIGWTQKIPIRKKSLLIWDGRLAHANFPNDSTKPRLVQYAKLNAVDEDIKSNVVSLVESFDEEELKEYFQNLNLSDRQKQIAGLKPWF
jgi:hypothetical protein